MPNHPETEIEKPSTQELRPASLYSIWQQRTSSATIYFIVKSVLIRAGIVERYDLLTLFDRQESSLSPQRFEDLIQKGVLVEWSI